MTSTAKNKIYNLNLFLLVVAIGFFMYWQKNIRTKDYSIPVISETSNFHSGTTLIQAKFEE